MALIQAKVNLGSPPHTWRILNDLFNSNYWIRITSTHVENTWILTAFTVTLEDHLHTRGEYCSNVKNCIFSTGSPPHTWRILFMSMLKTKQPRITSTHVENTAGYIGLKSEDGDHLHTRGEYNRESLNRQKDTGSPPHTWRILYEALRQDTGI